MKPLTTVPKRLTAIGQTFFHHFECTDSGIRPDQRFESSSVPMTGKVAISYASYIVMYCDFYRKNRNISQYIQKSRDVSIRHCVSD